jgi:hypothetical protein
MYASALDPACALLVGRFFGPSNTDDDFARYIKSILDADTIGLTRPGGVAVLLVERGNPMPNAYWRRRIADETAHIQSKDALFVLCTADPLIRGVLTAINWIRPPRYEVKITASVEDTAALLRVRRPDAADRAVEMIAALRAA